MSNNRILLQNQVYRHTHQHLQRTEIDKIARHTQAQIADLYEAGTAHVLPTLDANAQAAQLMWGQRGREVRELQKQLKALGYPISDPYGQLHESTMEAVKAFQRQQDIKTMLDGAGRPIIDPDTLAKIAKLAGLPRAHPQGAINRMQLGENSTGEAVRALQEKLSALDFNIDDPAAFFGPSTKEAIQALQKAFGLQPDGLVGHEERAKLEEALAARGGDPTKPRLLKKGTKGLDVSNIRRRLAELGYETDDKDGEFGDSTDAAVRRFQKDNGITVDGIVGPETRGKLKEPRLLKKGSCGEDVAAVQQRLEDLGYKSKDKKGEFGDSTDDAVRRFQKDNDLCVDGIVGPKTRAKMRELERQKKNDCPPESKKDEAKNEKDAKKPETKEAKKKETEKKEAKKKEAEKKEAETNESSKERECPPSSGSQSSTGGSGSSTGGSGSSTGSSQSSTDGSQGTQATSQTQETAGAEGTEGTRTENPHSREEVRQAITTLHSEEASAEDKAAARQKVTESLRADMQNAGDPEADARIQESVEALRAAADAKSGDDRVEAFKLNQEIFRESLQGLSPQQKAKVITEVSADLPTVDADATSRLPPYDYRGVLVAETISSMRDHPAQLGQALRGVSQAQMDTIAYAASQPAGPRTADGNAKIGIDDVDTSALTQMMSAIAATDGTQDNGSTKARAVIASTRALKSMSRDFNLEVWQVADKKPFEAITDAAIGVMETDTQQVFSSLRRRDRGGRELSSLMAFSMRREEYEAMNDPNSPRRDQPLTGEGGRYHTVFQNLGAGDLDRFASSQEDRENLGYFVGAYQGTVQILNKSFNRVRRIYQNVAATAVRVPKEALVGPLAPLKAVANLEEGNQSLNVINGFERLQRQLSRTSGAVKNAAYPDNEEERARLRQIMADRGEQDPDAAVESALGQYEAAESRAATFGSREFSAEPWLPDRVRIETILQAIGSAGNVPPQYNLNVGLFRDLVAFLGLFGIDVD